MEISLNPYLLKVLVNTGIQYSSDPSKLIAAIILPAAFLRFSYILNSRLNPLALVQNNQKIYNNIHIKGHLQSFKSLSYKNKSNHATAE